MHGFAAVSASTAPPAATGLTAGALNFAGRILGAVCAGLLALLLAVIAAAILLRTIGSSGLIGAEELATWLLPALVGAGLPLFSSGPMALRLDIFGSRLPARVNALRNILAEAVVVVSCLALVFGGVSASALIGGTSPLLHLPEPVRPLLLAGGGVLGILLSGLRAAGDNRLPAFAAAAAGASLVYAAAHILLVPSPLPTSVLLGVFAACALIIGVPMPHAFIAAGCCVVPFGSLLPEPAVIAVVLSGLQKYLLIAIPFFLLAGELLTASGIADDLVRFAHALVGHRRGGTAQTVLLTGVLFSGASGSSVANAAFGAKTFIPQLSARGWQPERAAALVAAVATLDNVIPPSIAFLILAAAANISVGGLMTWGFAAGGLMAATLAVAVYFTADPSLTSEKASARERLHYGLRAVPAFGLGLVIIAGIRFGLVSPTEAAALAALYTLAGALVKRRPIGDAARAFRNSAIETSAILLLIGAAAPFASLMATDGIARSLTALVRAWGDNPFLVMLAMNIILLGVGLVLDIGAAILLFAPLFLPAAAAAGMDPVLVGVVLVVNLMIGGVTPPVGILVQVVAGAGRVPAPAVFRAMKPCFLALIAALSLMAFTVAVLARP
ncbi:MAG: TRAP transporter large permease [Methylobacteriaceae bacterium]|jgi:tripartite ATP-independent transporter DctM subunit|nr:TRAP transporter large permease [Methylobacteriaceae bacterium]